MAHIRARGDKYTVEIHVQGFPRRTATFSTRRAAERWARTVEGEMADGRHFRDAEARNRTVAEAIDKYIKEEVDKLSSAGKRKQQLLWWRERIGTRKLAEVSSALISQHKQELATGTYTRAKPKSKRSLYREGGPPAPVYKRSGAIVDRYLAALSRVFTVAKREWQWTHSNPLESVAKFGGSRRIRYLVGDEHERLLAVLEGDPQLRLLVVLALSTTARAGELTSLTWDNVDLEEGRLLFPKTKNDDMRAAWAHGRALKLLRGRFISQGKPSGGGRVFNSAKGKVYRYDKPLKAALKAAGIEGFSFHKLRHSSATYLAREGATEQQLKAIGGWRSSVVAQYVHLAAEDARDIVRQMNEKKIG